MTELLGSIAVLWPLYIVSEVHPVMPNVPVEFRGALHYYPRRIRQATSRTAGGIPADACSRRVLEGRAAIVRAEE
jgi:hypothetical protein